MIKMGKNVKSYTEFINEEERFDWIKEKFKKVGDYFNKLKGKALVTIASSIIPTDLLNYIKSQALVSSNESFIFEEVKSIGGVFSEKTDILSPEEIDSLTDEEYGQYLSKISSEIVFETDLKGNISEDDKALYDLLTSNGIEVNLETIYKHEKSVDNIYRKIDNLKISPVAKKALRVACMVVLFGMMLFKGSSGYAAELPDTHGNGIGDIHSDGHGDDHSHDEPKKDDPRSFWDKISGKKVTTIHKTVTDQQAKVQAKRLKLKSPEDYIKHLQDKEEWSLTKVKSDTIHKTLLIQKPDTMIQVIDLGFDIDGDQFLTGKFELNQYVKDNIESEIDLIMSKGGVITNYAIESSTDKEPIKMGNDVLAQKRAEAIKKELSSIGVHDSLISIKTLPEQGPDIYTKTMTPKERSDARLETKDFRYVIVHILYYDKTVSVTPEIKQEIEKVKNTYYLDKQIIYKPSHPPKKGGPTKSKVKKHKKFFKNLGNGKNNVNKCWEPGSKNAWWNNLNQ